MVAIAICVVGGLVLGMKSASLTAGGSTLRRFCMDSRQEPFPVAALAEVTTAVTGAENDARRVEERLTHLADRLKIAPQVVAGDVDGDGKPDLVVSFGWCFAPVIRPTSRWAGRHPIHCLRSGSSLTRTA